MTEAIILFCTVFGTLIAYLTYIQPKKDLKEAKKILSEKFQYLRLLNSNLLSRLIGHRDANQNYNETFMQGLTLQQCIDILRKVQNELLSDENYLAIINARSKMRIDELIEKIEIQIKHHSEVNTVLEYFTKM